MLWRRLGAALLAGALLCGCRAAAPQTAEPQTATVYAMDVRMDLLLYGGEAGLADAAVEKLHTLDGLLSVTDADSEIYHLNQTGEAALSADTEALLAGALDWCRRTDGALDLTIYPVVRAWGFTTDTRQVPAAAELQALLARVDYTQVSLANGRARLPQGVQIDLGGVAKGYAGEILAGMLREGGVTSALLDLSGNIQTVGTKPDGTPWQIAIYDPQGTGYLGGIALTDEAAVTSGGYQRYFTDADGNTYWHIIDPETGYPAQSGLLSVTVVGKSGLACDALSTALFVMGAADAEAFWRADRSFEMALVTAEGELLLTPDLAERFTPEAEQPYAVRVLAE